MGKKRPQTRNHLQVARGSDLVVVRVVGTGNMITAPVLSEFMEHEVSSGFKRFVFDLSQCRGLDSTFMGCMVGLHNSIRGDESGDSQKPVRLDPVEDEIIPLTPEEALQELQLIFDGEMETGGEQPQPPLAEERDGYVIAVNVSPECRELLNILGVDRFVQIRGDADLAQLEMATLPERDMAMEERRILILNAHENLVEIDKRNEEKFGAFLRTLSEELAKESAL